MNARGVEKPQIFQTVLRDLGSVRQVWMVGDNPVADVAGAEAVGIPAILVRTRSAGVQRYAADLEQVARILAAQVDDGR